MRPESLRSGFLILVVIVAAGCANQRARFRPVTADERFTAGYPAAHHDLRAEGRLLGTTRIWTRGILSRGLDTPPVAHVGVRLENDSEQTVHIEPADMALTLHTRSGASVHVPGSAGPGDASVVAAQGTGRHQFEIELPAGIVIGDIEGFELAWIVRVGDHRVDLTTPFRREGSLPAGARCYLHPVVTHELPALPVAGTLVYDPEDLNWYVCHTRPGKRTFRLPERAPTP